MKIEAICFQSHDLKFVNAPQNLLEIIAFGIKYFRSNYIVFYEVVKKREEGLLLNFWPILFRHKQKKCDRLQKIENKISNTHAISLMKIHKYTPKNQHTNTIYMNRSLLVSPDFVNKREKEIIICNFIIPFFVWSTDKCEYIFFCMYIL